MIVADQLHLDVPGALDQLFEIHLVLAERGLGLALALGDFGDQRRLVHDPAHAAPAAAPDRLEHQRIADLGRQSSRTASMSSGSASVAGTTGTPEAIAMLRAATLLPRSRIGLRPRADEDDPRVLAGIGELGALREQPIARMDRIGAAQPRHADVLVDLEIGLDRALALADEVRLVRLEAVERELVLLGVAGDGLDVELVRGAENADRDFAAVGDEDLLDLHV